MYLVDYVKIPKVNGWPALTLYIYSEDKTVFIASVDFTPMVKERVQQTALYPLHSRLSATRSLYANLDCPRRIRQSNMVRSIEPGIGHIWQAMPPTYSFWTAKITLDDVGKTIPPFPTIRRSVWDVDHVTERKWPRRGTSWPSREKITEITQRHGPNIVAMRPFYWQVSYAESEKCLVRDLDVDGGCRKKAHKIMKELNKTIWSRGTQGAKPAISSYILKVKVNYMI